MTTSPFGLEIFAGQRTRVVAVRGRLLAGAGADARDWARAAAAGTADRVVLDLTGVSAIDARGIGRLLATRETLAARGARLTIAAASPRVWRVLVLVGLASVLAPDAAGATGTGPSIAEAMAGRLCRCA